MVFRAGLVETRTICHIPSMISGSRGRHGLPLLRYAHAAFPAHRASSPASVAARSCSSRNPASSKMAPSMRLLPLLLWARRRRKFDLEPTRSAVIMDEEV